MQYIEWAAVLHVAVVFVATVVMSANRTPSAAIAWVLAIILVPVIGLLVFLLVFLLVGRGRCRWSVATGSSNMDIRSFSLNMEVSLLVHGRDLVRRLRTVEDDYRANSDELDLAEWMRRPLPQKIGDSLARLTSSLQ